MRQEWNNELWWQAQLLLNLSLAQSSHDRDSEPPQTESDNCKLGLQHMIWAEHSMLWRTQPDLVSNGQQAQLLLDLCPTRQHQFYYAITIHMILLHNYKLFQVHTASSSETYVVLPRDIQEKPTK